MGQYIPTKILYILKHNSLNNTKIYIYLYQKTEKLGYYYTEIASNKFKFKFCVNFISSSVFVFFFYQLYKRGVLSLIHFMYFLTSVYTLGTSAAPHWSEPKDKIPTYKKNKQLICLGVEHFSSCEKLFTVHIQGVESQRNTFITYLDLKISKKFFCGALKKI